jgi:hypothetical protein
MNSNYGDCEIILDNATAADGRALRLTAELIACLGLWHYNVHGLNSGTMAFEHRAEAQNFFVAACCHLQAA